MYWQSWSDFWHMEGDAFFVWLCLGSVVMVLLIEILRLRIQWHGWKK